MLRSGLLSVSVRTIVEANCFIFNETELELPKTDIKRMKSESVSYSHFHRARVFSMLTLLVNWCLNILRALAR
jgi:hypothetical protein